MPSFSSSRSLHLSLKEIEATRGQRRRRRRKEEEDPAKYWTTLRKRQDTAICKKVH